MKICYVRVSTLDQNLDLQLQELQKAGCKKIYQEKVSGVKRHRPELEALLKQLREGDTLVIWRLDRLARSTRDLLEIVERIDSSQANFYYIQEPWANTTSSAGRMLLTVFVGIAEFERGLIIDRTILGRKVALLRGVKFGRPQKIRAEQKSAINDMIGAGKSIKEISRTFSIHPTTLYRNFLWKDNKNN